jgi:hypothetical protein
MFSALPEGKELTNSIGIKLIRIMPGSFQMGQNSAKHDFVTIDNGPLVTNDIDAE